MAVRDYSLSGVLPTPDVPVVDPKTGLMTEEWRRAEERQHTALFGPTGEIDITADIPTGSYVGLVAVDLDRGLSVTGIPAAGYTATLTLSQDIRTSASPTFVTGTFTGNIIVAGQVDGRDVSVDGAKLDGIASGATANATNAELRDRATHTGTQTALTISDFNSSVDARITGKADKQATALTNAVTAHAVTDFPSTNAALDALGARINALHTVLRAAGIGT